MDSNIKVSITKNPINIQEGYNFVQCPSFGAFNSFVGVVRNTHEGNEVVAINYDAHEQLAENTLLKICQEALEKWQNIKVYASHFKGELKINGISVYIAVGSKHRDESFKACRYIIEEIKTRLPVWKQEYYTNGKSAWLKGHSLT